MSKLRLSIILVAISLSLVAACDDDDRPVAAVDAPPPRSIDPAGRYAITSMFALAEPPALVAPILAELTAATDGPDDPSRFLIDRMIERLPEGRTRTIATALAPYVAAYVNGRIGAVAPRFVSGVRALGEGVARIATRFGTIEDVRIDPAGGMRRTVEAVRFDGVEIPFALFGLSDVTVDTRVVLAGDRLSINDHVIGIAYTQLLRAGLDHAVIPSVVPGATDLASALAELVDCAHLGALVAERVGLGSAGLYAEACRIGLTAAASRIYARFPAIDAPRLTLEARGVARAVDRDGDGRMDAIENGAWTGAFDHAPLGLATFTGTAP